MAKKKTNGLFWISRWDGCYMVHRKEPTDWSNWNTGELECFDDGEIELCRYMFKRLTGLELEDGQYAQFRLSRVGDVWEPILEESNASN